MKRLLMSLTIMRAEAATGVSQKCEQYLRFHDIRPNTAP
jgi:hypothetical protein